MADEAKPTPLLKGGVTKVEKAAPPAAKAAPAKPASQTKEVGNSKSGCSSKPKGEKKDKKDDKKPQEQKAKADTAKPPSKPLQGSATKSGPAGGKPLTPKFANPSAPAYTPKAWTGKIQDNSNCYQYAVDYPTDQPRGKGDPNYDPGEFADKSDHPGLWLQANTDAGWIRENARKDGLFYIDHHQWDPPPALPGFYLVAVFVKPGHVIGGDYDWARQDRDGTWSHKPGTSAVEKLVDKDGNPVTNPREATYYEHGKPYTEFGGWFLVPEGGIKPR